MRSDELADIRGPDDGGLVSRGAATWADRVASAALGRWDAMPRPVRDGWLPVVLAGGSFVPGIAHNGIALGELAERRWDALAVVLIAAQSLPLALARRWPVLVLGIVGLAFALFQCLGYPPAFAGLGVLAAVFLASLRRGSRAGLVAVIGLAAYVVLAIVLRALGSPERLIDFVTFLVVLALPWWAGGWWRRRINAEQDRRHLEAERAVAAERRRIARELHDVVTHHVTAMVVQADAEEVTVSAAESGPAAGDERERVTKAFVDIGTSGRRALSDLRELLALLSEGGQARPYRHPHLSAVGDLVDQARRTGQRVELDDQIDARVIGSLSDAAQLAAYRVVQEALTNARKHALGQAVEVRLLADGEAVQVTVVNPLPAAHPVRPTGGAGYGLAGLRERVALVGGTFDATTDGGLYTVRACIPIGTVP